MRFRLLLSLALGPVACQALEPPPAPIPPASGAPAAPSEVRLFGVVAESFHADRLVSRATAAELRVDRRKGEVRASPVEIERFDAETAQPTGRLSAARAVGHLSSRDVLLEGDVTVRDVANRSARSERAQYLDAAQRLEMPGPVEVRGDNFEASGASARYAFESERLEVAPPIRAEVRPAPGAAQRFAPK